MAPPRSTARTNISTHPELRPAPEAPPDPKHKHGWFVREGPVEDHFKVWPLVATVLFPCMGVLLVGFDTGATAWLDIAIELCAHKYSYWCDDLERNVYLAATLNCTSQMSAAVTCLVLYALAGPSLSGRTELLLASMFFIVGSTVEAESAEMMTSVYGLVILFIGRAIYGVGIALSLHACPNFISEAAPPKLRGTLCGFIELSITCGLIYAYAVGQWLTYEFPYEFSWKYTFKFGTIFGIIMFFGMLYLPESPRWLVGAGRPLYEALEAAQFVNPSFTSEHVVKLKRDLERTSRSNPDGGESVTRRLFCSPELRVPMLVGVGVIAAQQLTGLPSMLYYMIDIMKEVASANLMPALLSFAGCKLAGATLAMLFLDSWGRRTPLITGLVVMFVCSGVLFMFFYDSLERDAQYQTFFVVLLDAFVIGYEVSVGAVPFVLLGEIFPADVKGSAVSIAFLANFLLATTMTFLMYYEINELGYTVVWAQLSVTAFLFVFFVTSLVPETMGKSLEEIQKEFQQEFDLPDFMAAVDYLSGGENVIGSAVGAAAGQAGAAAREAAREAGRAAAGFADASEVGVFYTPTSSSTHSMYGSAAAFQGPNGGETASLLGGTL